MTYDIFSINPPQQPKPSRGTEIIKFLLSKASANMRQPLLPMAFPALAAHMTGVEVQYSNGRFYEIGPGQLGLLLGASGIGKNQLSHLVSDAICRDFIEHDNLEYKRLAEWIKQVKTLGGNKAKPERPSIYLVFPPCDCTHPSIIQNFQSLEDHEGRTMYMNLPEIGLANKICGGHRNVSEMIRQCYDVARGGQMRATVEGITGNPVQRLSMTLSSTPDEARAFMKNDMRNGFFGRITCAYIPRGERIGRIPKQKPYDEEYLAKLDEYLARLTNVKGRFIVKPLARIADQLAEEMAQLADMCDSDELFELSHRSIFSSWKKAAVLYFLNNQTYTRSIADYMIYFCYYDLWSKCQVFGDMFNKVSDTQQEEVLRRGPKNLLQELPNPFSELQLEGLRVNMGKSKEGTRHQISVWSNRGLIEQSAQTGLFSKTNKFFGIKVKKNG